MPFTIAPILLGGYEVLNCIDFDGAERKICSDCVDELRVGIKSDILKKVGESTLYTAEESEEE